MACRILVVGAVAVAVASGGGVAQAQTEENPRGPVMVFDAGELLAGLVSLTVELSPSERLSVYVGPWAYLFEGPLLSHLEEPGGLDWAFGAMGGVRLHFVEEAPYGLWVGPELWLGGVQGRLTDGTGADGFAWATALVVGATWLLGSGVVFSVGAGPMYVDLRADAAGMTVGYEGVTALTRIALGFAF